MKKYIIKRTNLKNNKVDYLTEDEHPLLATFDENINNAYLFNIDVAKEDILNYTREFPNCNFKALEAIEKIERKVFTNE